MATIYETFQRSVYSTRHAFESSGALDLESLTRLTKYFSSRPGVAGLVSCAALVRAPF